VGMIDHVDIRVSDLRLSRAFYAAALEPLGFGDRNGVEFALHEPTPQPGQDTVTRGSHIAFTAAGPDAVGAFHKAALAAGGNNIEAVCELDA
jgi:catechol 2,3-dioxygenase-like lactoylglutathione lyase family enzyme